MSNIADFLSAEKNIFIAEFGERPPKPYSSNLGAYSHQQAELAAWLDKRVGWIAALNAATKAELEP